jgi:hypothetical protein
MKISHGSGESKDRVPDFPYPHPYIYYVGEPNSKLKALSLVFSVVTLLILKMLSSSLFAAAALLGLSQAQQPSKDDISPSGGPYDTIPRLGFGTWMLDDEKNATEAVAMAMVNGYRHFDCATAYQNQVAIGKGLAEGLKRTGLNRSEIWVSSKLWSTRLVIL